MSLDDSFSPLVSLRAKCRFKSTELTPVQPRRDIAPKLSLKSHIKAMPDNVAITQTPKNQPVSAAFLFSTCKKKLLGSSFPESSPAVLVADSSEDEYYDGEDFLVSSPMNSKVHESLEEYSLIRKWFQNAETINSSSDSDTDVELPTLSKNVSTNSAKYITKDEFKSPKEQTSITQKEEIVILSSDDEDEFENYLKNILKKTEEVKAIKVPSTSHFIDDESFFDDDDDTSFVFQSIQDHLRTPVTKNTASEVSVARKRGDVETVVLTSEAEEEDLFLIKSVQPKSRLKQPKEKEVSPYHSDLEDIFGNLDINETKKIKPKSKKLTKADRQLTRAICGPRENFLSSLSTELQDTKRHPDAVQYVKSFKKLRNELTLKMFNIFNEEVFHNQLPRDFSLTWNNRLTRTAGYCRHFTRREEGLTSYESKIELSVKVVDTPARLRDTLVHEMCHAATWIIDNCRGGHGPVWKKYANMVHRVFPELPAITRCHNYEITYKFYYNCSKCPFSTGRHSKSIDTTTHVCPYCKSTLHISKERNGKENEKETKPSAPKTPRTPNAFALFVKAHFATTKSSRPDLPHAAIMKLLSAKFADSKKSAIGQNVFNH